MLGADQSIEDYELGSRVIDYTGSGPDRYEGMWSFLEKRPPAFKTKVSEDIPTSVRGRPSAAFAGDLR